MPTSVPGSRRPLRRRSAGRGFTMVELLIVIAIIAVAVALVSVALPDGDAARLEEEGERLTALLELARAEARVSGVAVHWVPRADGAALGGITGTTGTTDTTDAGGAAVHFRFVGLPAALALPSRWLDDRVSAQVVGSRSLVLGPAAILPAQRVVLRLAERRLELLSDGLGPFAVADGAAAATETPR